MIEINDETQLKKMFLDVSEKSSYCFRNVLCDLASKHDFVHNLISLFLVKYKYIEVYFKIIPPYAVTYFKMFV